MKVPATVEITQVRMSKADARFAATMHDVVGSAPTPWGALIDLAHVLAAMEAARSVPVTADEALAAMGGVTRTVVPDPA